MIDRFPRLTVVLLIGLILGVVIGERWFFVTRVAPRLPDSMQTWLIIAVAVGIPILYVVERRQMAKGGDPIKLSESIGLAAGALVAGSALYWLAGYRIVAVVAALLVLSGYTLWAIFRRRAS